MDLITHISCHADENLSQVWVNPNNVIVSTQNMYMLHT